MRINGKLNYLTKLEIILKYKKIEQSKFARTSTIYRFNDETLLKLFKYNKKDELDKYELFCDLNLYNFATPKKLIYILGWFYGYIMNIMPGNMLESINLDTLLSGFFNKLYKIEENIYTISKNKIIICDLHDQNILYDDKSNELYVIDMDDYYLCNRDTSIEELYINNIKKLYSTLFEVIAGTTSYHSLYNSIIEDEEKIENLNGKILFNKLITEVENRCDTKISTINDYRENIKKLI